MKRENRYKEESSVKSFIYLGGSILGIAILVFIAVYMFIGGGASNKSDISKLSTAKIENLVPNNVISTNTKTEPASTQIGKSVEEAKKTLDEEKEIKQEKPKENTIKATNVKPKEEKAKEKAKETKIEEKAPVFVRPIEGEIIREYAKDKLVYSETLKEWITHPGIDIKADKTSVVKSSADGRVLSIKNDPRYGLTVIIEHQAGYKTVYSNLLTAEFVTEGEEVQSGQTIGTIGNTATFEVLDPDHLHFEILKNNENVDPGIYIQ